MIIDTILNDFDDIFSHQSLEGAEIMVYAEEEIKELCQEAVNSFGSQPTIVRIDKPVIIIGDIHGSLDDLMRIIKLFGKPPETNYLFLGDYVDRGQFSVPVIEYLLAIACKYPDHVWLLRGNHEFSHINRVYGFYEEIIESVESELAWEYFQEVFYYLPLAAIVFDKVFCVHGGLSPNLVNLNELENLSRPIPNYLNLPLVSDLVWSDPTEETPEFAVNQRGSGVLFGNSAVERFLVENKMQLIVRGHQCTANGVHSFANSMGVTVFSCSDYSGVEKNKCGAFNINSLTDITIYSLTKAEGGGFTKDTIRMQVKDGAPGIEIIPKKKKKAMTQKLKITIQQPQQHVNDDDQLPSVSSVVHMPSVTQAPVCVTPKIATPHKIGTKITKAATQLHQRNGSCVTVRPMPKSPEKGVNIHKESSYHDFGSPSPSLNRDSSFHDFSSAQTKPLAINSIRMEKRSRSVENSTSKMPRIPKYIPK